MNGRLGALLVCLALITSGTGAQPVSVVNSKHNLSASGPGTIKAQSAQDVCVFCHTPHGASATAQLWNRSQPSGTYTLYSSDYLTSLTYPTPTQPKAKSKLCMSCHDGTIALGSVFNVPGSGDGGGTPIQMVSSITTMPTGAAGYLGTTLTDDHPVGFIYDPAKDTELVTRAWPWNTAVKLDPDSSAGTVECFTCHEPHNNQYTKFLRMDNTNAALCTHCHNKTNYSTSAHSNSTQNFTPPGGSATTVGENSCRNCHKPHSSGGTPYILRAAEENTCYESGCHGTNNPGTNTTPASNLIELELSKTHRHPVNTYSTRHKNVKDPSGVGGESIEQLGGALAVNRHAECMDCHNPHQAQNAFPPATRVGQGITNISPALKGTWGIKPTPPWPTAPTTMADNKVTFAVIPAGAAGYTRVSGTNLTDEYMVCLKCHSNYVTLPSGVRNIAQEINPTNSSYHGIVPCDGVPGCSTNTFVNSTTANEPWATTKRVWCSDCHGSESASSPRGPHGSALNGIGPGTSNTDKMLVATIVPDSANGGTPLCLVCHKAASYRDGNTGSNNSRHGADTPIGRAPEGCFSCHMWENPATFTNGTGKIFPHGMNSLWALRGLGPDAGSGQPVKAFNGGWYTNMDYLAKTCWTSVPAGRKDGLPTGSPCNVHTNQGY